MLRVGGRVDAWKLIIRVCEAGQSCAACSLEEVFVLWPQGSNCSYICQTCTTQRSITQAHLLAAPSSSTHPLTQSPPLPSLWRCAEYRRARSCMAGLQRMLSSLSPALRVLFCSTFSLYARLPVPSSSSSFSRLPLSLRAASLSSLHLSLSSPFLHRHPRDSQPPKPPRRICFTKPSIFSSLHRLPSFLSVSLSFQKSIYY